MTDEYVLENPRSDRVKRVAALATRAGRKKQRLFLAEGPQPVREALKLWLYRCEQARPLDADPLDAAPSARASGTVDWSLLPELDALYFDAAALQRHPDVAALLDQVRGVLFDPQVDLPRQDRIFLREATPEVLAAMGDAETSQGFVAVCRIPAEVGHLPVPHADPVTRLGAVLVGLQDPGNVGTLIRTADAAGADVVVLAPGSADPWSPKVVRAAAGSHFHLPVMTGVNIAELVEYQKSQGMQVLAAHGHAALSLAELNATDPASSAPHLAQSTLWLFGNEAHGLSEPELSLADAAVSIPLYGQAESLNVAVAGAVCLYASAMAHRAGAQR